MGSNWILTLVVVIAVVTRSNALDCYSCHFSNVTFPATGSLDCLTSPTDVIPCDTGNVCHWTSMVDKRMEVPKVFFARGCVNDTLGDTDLYCHSYTLPLNVDNSFCHCKYDDKCNGEGSNAMRSTNGIFSFGSILLISFWIVWKV